MLCLLVGEVHWISFTHNLHLLLTHAHYIFMYSQVFVPTLWVSIWHCLPQCSRQRNFHGYLEKEILDSAVLIVSYIISTYYSNVLNVLYTEELFGHIVVDTFVFVNCIFHNNQGHFLITTITVRMDYSNLLLEYCVTNLIEMLECKIITYS